MAWLNSPAVELGFPLILLWIIYRFVTKRKCHSNKGKLGLPPGPRPWPLIGNLHLLGSLPHKSLADLAKKHGPIMSFRLGSVPTIVASSPAMAKEFLKTHDLIFANRPPSAAAHYMAYQRRNMVFAPYGEYCRQIRKLCTIELLTTKRTESFRWVREEEVSAMVRSVWEKSDKAMRCIELRNPISSLTLNIICRMFAGRTFSDHELGGGVFLEMMDEIMHLGGVFVLGDYILSVAFLDLGGFCRRMQAVHKIYDEFADKLIDEHVDRRRAKKSESLDIVDVLLHMAESENSAIEDMLSGGVETSAATVEWAITELLRNPQVMARGQQEIDLQVGRDRIVRESDLLIDCFDWSAEGDLDRDEEFGLTLPKKSPLSALPSWRLTTDEPL
ncbi:cytochrome P450 750A1-like [Cryptomeria japonica]|uniref:cytochrome P450 750A1-like n=1 Tax=Cryptomeria japonica TaxID=3369 RepID=UPI0027DA9782|nr:cytochrome P450 750A1-like [Cryptomeria japonica]